MALKVATTSFLPQSPSSSQTLASSFTSFSSKRRRTRHSGEGASALACRYVQGLNRSALLGISSTKLHRSQSYEYPISPPRTLKRACSASLDAFSDEEFSKRIDELARRFQLSDEEDEYNIAQENSRSKFVSNSSENDCVNSENEEEGEDSHASIHVPLEPPNWSPETTPDESIIRKANRVDIPLSLRIIKRKMQWQEGFKEAGESAYCSMKKAFSSMVFIIRELHSYTLQMREILFTEDLREILARVQQEMHASFVWLFQQVFSHTPTLMVYVMILLANFTVYSVGCNPALAASPLPAIYSSITEESTSVIDIQDSEDNKFDSSSIKSFSVSSSSGKTTTIGSHNGNGGGKVKPVTSGTDGDGFDGSKLFKAIVPDGASQLSSFGTTVDSESVSGQVIGEEEMGLWNSVVEEASRMQSSIVDHETMQRFVSPVKANIEPDNYSDYFRTGFHYHTELVQDPNNPLLLTNYAQFLYIVAHDYDRAEEYFKRAIGVEPPDAEAYSKYASFLWKVKNDLWAAEETFLEAIAADPTNSFHAANYAHFLWNTDGEDTCYPLDKPHQDA
ncbi:TPR_16 domain-containing protein [Cephalotus follicularis]|uniref:TPR_16 domain-containing protein n=1 Tax=Cephalotus follicularis TaxID=3775 RepID=A0A1Q3C2V6_CEPFO|nr:TPR_16 domain-containing protein [Cephalotus follicularis]